MKILKLCKVISHLDHLLCKASDFLKKTRFLSVGPSCDWEYFRKRIQLSEFHLVKLINICKVLSHLYQLFIRNHLHSFSRNRFQENGRKKRIWCAVCAILWSTHLDIATNDVLQPPYHQTNTPLLPYSMSIPSKFISFRCTTYSVPGDM